VARQIKSRPLVDDLVSLFAALGDPTRLRLLSLMHGREVCVCYFVEILGQSQPKISRHLAYLRKVGLVHARRDGKWMHYSIHAPRNTQAAEILQATLQSCQSDTTMQSDLRRLARACCEPQTLVSLQGVPVPTRTAVEA